MNESLRYFQIESPTEKSIFTLHLTFNCVFYTQNEDEHNKIQNIHSYDNHLTICIFNKLCKMERHISLMINLLSIFRHFQQFKHCMHLMGINMQTILCIEIENKKKQSTSLILI